MKPDINCLISGYNDDWKWSSCEGYYGNDYYPPGLLNYELLFGRFSEDKDMAIKKFIEYNESANVDKFLDDDTRTRSTDEEARKEITNRIHGFRIPETKGLPKVQRDQIILWIKERDRWSATTTNN